ncbi:signal recognition particle-docking protein FtsY [Calidifontibacter sp. DB0510]|uniref:Signal recognition particle receptor FtsY n=1 Tax=Metallococcus carri TaxID=1656884 RepID=A0A967AXT0_9MICO|nr:signal recognition particle-docking protein FtsY [Metallococcus carri]NHN54412.1 signal recognition particle-docking protein FtsY [Metallococcus carri]NOP36749.1 signal recognition particle-docking protein FtsY [Calidifontibacter sp. DB2511S]
MDQLWEILTVITVILVAGVVGAVALVRGRGRGGATKELPPQETQVPSAKDAPTRGANTYKPSSTATIDTSKGATPAPPKDDEPAEVPTGPTVEDNAPAIPETAPVETEPEVGTERPESARNRMTRLRSRLAGSQNTMGKGLLSLLSAGSLDETVWEEVEDTLLGADLGVEATTELVDNLKRRVSVEGTPTAERLEAWLHEELLTLVNPDLDRRIAASRQGDRPAVIMVVGVNGTGKTTTVGKLARVLVAEDKEVLLGAADTFRAAAADQLETWGARVGVATVRSDKEGADPAAVAFDAVKDGKDEEVDVVIIDTAGRLHNKVGLMDELSKVKRVIEKQSPIDECLLVLDATTGQNGMRQAEVFAQAVDITGVVLTKLDGTAKGGIVVLVQRELGVPVKLVGLGEGADDLAPFDPKAFVDAVLD